MNDRSLVYLDRASKIYLSQGTTVYAAREITLEVQAGEFYSLLGSSGSGKTTTLRLIGGFEIPEQGRVWIGGEDVTTLPPYRRNVHTVFQSYALFPHLTVAENIAYPLRIAKVSREAIAPQVTEALKMFRIEGLGDRRPSQLSGGQQQRVALARALINRPKVLLLDEPLSALDAKIREEVRQELRDLQRQTNLTFIYVTHDQEEAMALSDRIAVMHNGQVRQIGTSTEIYDRPTSLFVAQFIGKANLLSGTVTKSAADATWIQLGGMEIRAIAPTILPSVGSTVTVMIRPERIQLNPTHPTDNRISGKLSETIYVGQLLEMQIDTVIAPLRVVQLSGQAIGSEALTLGWNATDCVVIPDA